MSDAMNELKERLDRRKQNHYNVATRKIVDDDDRYK